MTHFNQHISENNRKILYRLLVSYSLLILLLLIIGLSFYHSAVRNTELQIKQQNEFTLQSKVTDFDSSLYIFNSFSAQISTNSNIRHLMLENKLSTAFYLDAADAMNYLTEIMCMQSALPIENCFIYLPQTEYIILPTTSMSAYNYYNYRKKYLNSRYENWLSLISTYNNTNCFLPLESYLSSNSDKDSYLYVCNLYTGSAASEPGAFLCYTIDKDKLLSGFSELSSSNDISFYVENSMQNLSYSLFNGDSLAYDPSILVSLYLKDPSDSSYTLDHNEYVITHTVSSYNKWDYYLLQPSSDILNDFNTYKKLYQFLIIIASTCSVLGIFLITRHNMKPYIEIQNRLENSESEKESLHNELLNQRPYVYNAYLARIMNGNMNNINNMSEILTFLKLDFTKSNYAVLYIIIVPSYDKINEVLNDSLNVDLEMEEVNQNSAETIEGLFREYWGSDICIYKPEPQHYALLLPLTDNNSNYDFFVEETHTKFTFFQQILEKEHSLLIGAGLGKANARVNYIWESFHLAKEAVSFISKEHTFQCYKNIIRGNDVYYYPTHLIEQLTLFITTGNSRQTAEIFKIILNENFELRSLQLHIQEWLISDLRNTLVKIRYEMIQNDTNDLSFAKLDELMLSIKTVDDARKIALYMASLHEHSTERNKLITTIEQYIIENYTDADLSLKKISEVFEISECYFSSLFKTETKQNFSEYLEHLRMVHSMALLKNAKVNISDIFSLVGYNNPNSFRRAFKKTYGVSPSSIRSVTN